MVFKAEYSTRHVYFYIVMRSRFFEKVKLKKILADIHCMAERLVVRMKHHVMQD